VITLTEGKIDLSLALYIVKLSTFHAMYQSKFVKL